MEYIWLFMLFGGLLAIAILATTYYVVLLMRREQQQFEKQVVERTKMLLVKIDSLEEQLKRHRVEENARRY